MMKGILSLPENGLAVHCIMDPPGAAPHKGKLCRRFMLDRRRLYINSANDILGFQ
jgi:hypothetical protein